MARKKIIEKIYILIILLYLANSLSCDGYEIDNCLKCGSGKNSSRCEICQDKYFLVLNGEYCINCDHEKWGMPGCAGRCEPIKSIENVNCTDNICKEGYYLIYPGFCAICSFLFDHCKRCTYHPDINGNKTFKCLECEDRYYFSDGKCKKCIDGCKKCKDYSQCTEYYPCNEQHYRTPEGNCAFCLSHCKKCRNNLTCDECLEDYYWDSYTQKCKNCFGLCPDVTLCKKSIPYCYKCQKDSDSICTNCISYYYLSSDGKQCKPCKRKKNNEGCLICSDDEDKKCQRCDDGYYFISEEECGKCSDLFGDNCTSCSISPYDFKPYCTKCSYGYAIGSNGKCKKYNEKIYSAQDYILVDNDYYILRNSSKAIPNCIKMELINIDDNGNEIYSCLECFPNYILSIDVNRIKTCVNPESYKHLDLCLISRKENIGENNYTCLLCQRSLFVTSEYDKELQKKICKCEKEYYFKKYSYSYDERCGKCSKIINNCNECYENESRTIICNRCEEGYALTNNNQCEPCRIYKCLKCDKDLSSCEKYQEPYFHSNGYNIGLTIVNII
jgi:hypothetical protein